MGERLIWWVAAEHGRGELSRDLIFQICEAVNNWLDRAVPVFERQVEALTGPAVLIALDFNDLHQEEVDPISENVLRSCLSVSTDCETKTIRISFHDPFLGGFRNPRNVAERTIIRAIAMGVVRLGGGIPTEDILAALVSKIAPNEDIRYVHFFEATRSRDIIQRLDRPRKLFVDDADTASNYKFIDVRNTLTSGIYRPRSLCQRLIVGRANNCWRKEEGMDISIIEASPADAGEILLFQKLAYQSEAKLNDDWTIPPLPQTLLEIEAEFENRVFLKLMCAGRIIGSVRASLNAGTCLIGRLIVHPDYQGKGIGTLLMGQIEKVFPHAKRFELFTGAKSVDNIRLCQRLGYRECREEDLSPKVRLVFMEKRQ